MSGLRITMIASTLIAGSLQLSCTDNRYQLSPTLKLKSADQSTADAGSPSTETATVAKPGRLIMRRANVIRNSISKALVVNPTGMCLELGRLPCVDIVHRVALGGVDAYTNTQYLHPVDISVTAPAALERIAMSACVQRANTDLVAPAQAVIFKNIELSVDGRLIDSAAVSESINTLYKRLFSRFASTDEINALRQLYVSIYEAEPRGAARNWMVLACFAVASSAESFFY